MKKYGPDGHNFITTNKLPDATLKEKLREHCKNKTKQKQNVYRGVSASSSKIYSKQCARIGASDLQSRNQKKRR